MIAVVLVGLLLWCESALLVGLVLGALIRGSHDRRR